MISGKSLTNFRGYSLTKDKLWTPRELFRQGTQGAWYDISDLSTLFQDTAGLIPAVVNQQVALVKDKSGNGNHLTQETLGARPYLYQDSDNKFYLLFDGVDDYMASPSFSWGSNNMLMTLLANIPVAAGDFISFGSYNNVSTWNLRISGNRCLHFISRGDGATSAVTSPAGGPSYLNRKVVITQWATISAPNVGGQYDSANAVNNAQAQGAGNFGTNTLELGRRNPGGSYGKIAIYGLCTTAARHRGFTKLETYMGKLK